MTRESRQRGVIVSIGDEVVGGRIVDTNAPWLARVLDAMGIVCVAMETVADDPDAIEALLRRWVSDADLIVTIGGLGPTDDDRTRQALFAVAAEDLERDASSADAIRARLGTSGITVDERQLRQADRPSSMRSIPNAEGTAPGIIGEIRGSTVWVLPGPPDELRPMVEAHLASVPQREGQRPKPRREIVLFGMAEAHVDRLAAVALQGADGCAFSIRVTKGLINVRLESWEEDQLERAAEHLRFDLGHLVLPSQCATPADAARSALEERGLSVAVAESCTAGALGAALTHRSGASGIFKGGLLTYADAAKVDLASVPPLLLGDDGPGAVSREVAEAMATGARGALHADAALSVTGVAGPEGGTPRKPVGTVCIATDVQGDVRSRVVRLPGNRPRVRQWSVHAACMALRWHVQGVDACTQWDVAP